MSGQRNSARTYGEGIDTDKVSDSESAKSEFDKGLSDNVVNSWNSVETAPSSRNYTTRIEKNEIDDNKSNASSTDDYVSELLDPSDRKPNVWHVVERARSKNDGDSKESEEEIIQPPPTPPTPPNIPYQDSSPYLPNAYSGTPSNDDLNNLKEKEVDDCHDNSEALSNEQPAIDDKDEHRLSGGKNNDSDSIKSDKYGSHSRDGSRSRGKDRTRDRDRDRDRDSYKDRDRHRDLNRDRDRDRDRDRHRDRDIDKSKTRDRDRDRIRHGDRRGSLSGSRERIRSRERSRSRERTRSRDEDNSRHGFKSRDGDRKYRHNYDIESDRYRRRDYDEDSRGRKHSDRDDNSRKGSNAISTNYRIYVGGLHVAITEEMLRTVFEPFGHIVRVELMKDRNTNQSRGYAFITYAKVEDGQLAETSLDGLEIAGKNLRVSKSK